MRTEILTSYKRDPSAAQYGYDRFVFDIKDTKKDEVLKSMDQFLLEKSNNKYKVIRANGAV